MGKVLAQTGQRYSRWSGFVSCLVLGFRLQGGKSVTVTDVAVARFNARRVR